MTKMSRWVRFGMLLATAMPQAACGGGGTQPPTDEFQPPQEVCNGRDDDDDGACDEGYECCAGGIVSCDTGCGSSGWQRCATDCRVAAGESCQP